MPLSTAAVAQTVAQGALVAACGARPQFAVARCDGTFFDSGSRAGLLGDESVNSRVLASRFRCQSLAPGARARRHGLRVLPEIPPEPSKATGLCHVAWATV